MRAARISAAGIDPAAWEEAGRLQPSRLSAARSGLRALADAGHPTDLNCVVNVRVFAKLTHYQRIGLRTLWVAVTPRLRQNLLPYGVTADMSQQIQGIDVQTVNWVREAHRTRRLQKFEGTAVWYWLGQLAKQQLPTDLETDFDDPVIGQLLAQAMRDAANDELAIGPRVQKLHWFRRALRNLYSLAREDDLRTAEVPAVLLLERQPGRGARERVAAKLPAADRERLEQVFARLEDLVADHQAGRAESFRGPRGGRMTTAPAQGTTKTTVSALYAFLYHADAQGWTPYQLEDLLTSQRVIHWAWESRTPSGDDPRRSVAEKRWPDLKRLLRLAEDAGEPLIPTARIQDIDKAVNECSRPKRIRARSRDDDDRSDYKFFPTRKQIDQAIAVIEEKYLRTKTLYDGGHGTASYFQMWEALQLRTLFHGFLICMWRKDTACTIDLLKLRQDSVTKSPVRPDGSALVRGARAKEVAGEYYVELQLPGLFLDYARELLEFEGRSLEQPLRTGEKPQHLRARVVEQQGGKRRVVCVGDRWGRDQLLIEDLKVAPLFRARPHAPDGHSYEQMERRMRWILKEIGWPQAVPHSLRVMGALWWKFRGVDYDEIMELGRWRDVQTLLRCYAHLNKEDRRARVAAAAPSQVITAGQAARDRREAALRRLQRAALDLAFAEDPELLEFERFTRSAQSDLDDIVRANAAARGQTWQPPRPARTTLEEDLRADEHLKAGHAVPGGLAELYGRDILASDAMKRDRAQDRETGPLPQRLRRVMDRARRTRGLAISNRASA